MTIFILILQVTTCHFRLVKMLGLSPSGSFTPVGLFTCDSNFFLSSSLVDSAGLWREPVISDTNTTDCPSSDPQGNQKDSRLTTASSQ